MFIFIICTIGCCIYCTSAAPPNNVDSLESVNEPVFYSLKDAPALFENFISEYNKKYNAEEKNERFKIFVDNLKKINSLNEKSSNAVYSVNEFSDLSEEEFKKFYTGLKLEKSLWNGDYEGNKVPVSFNFTAPDAFDWRDKGVVSRVKKQGTCGSCWAFSATGNVESVNAIKTGQITEISEQQLVDCDSNSYGCQGGLSEYALGYLVSHGAMSESSYPYVANNQNCKYDSSNVVVKISSYEHVQLSEDEMKQKLYSTAPLCIAIAAGGLSAYNGGIVVDTCATYVTINHAVLLVGYGSEGGTDFWLIKNSWGDKWGEDGYFRIKRGVNCLQVTDQGVVTSVM